MLEMTKQQEHLRGEGRLGIRVFGCAHAALMIASLILMKSILIGLGILGIGLVMYFVGLKMLFSASNAADITFARCLKVVDERHPELLVAMEKYKQERISEEWDPGTF